MDDQRECDGSCLTKGDSEVSGDFVEGEMGLTYYVMIGSKEHENQHSENFEINGFVMYSAI